MMRFVTAVFLSVFLVATNANAEKVQISAKNGLKLNANLVLADGKSLSDGAVLLTHGTLAHNGMEIIVAMQELLAERGISSLAHSLALGISNRTGMYDCTKPHTHKNTDFLDEISLWLDWLEQKGATDITIVGHSRGGNQVAWYAGEKDRPSISRVVLVAPGTWSQNKAASGFKRAHKAELKGVLSRAEELLAAGKGGEMMKGVGLLYCPGADVTAESFVSYYNNDMRRDTPTVIPNITKPTLLIIASEDTINPKMHEAAKPFVGSGKIEMVVIDGAGHFFRDLYGDDIADAMEEFITR
ncbi:MAG: alpha/beta hydrolase [Rhodospirillaceae bacterium]|nr:alpha/beta hydrolase [Rhodospirillaceae bacterium]